VDAVNSGCCFPGNFKKEKCPAAKEGRRHKHKLKFNAESSRFSLAVQIKKWFAEKMAHGEWPEEM